MYPRVGNGARLWMDPRDVAASPTLWRAVAAQESNTTVPDFDYASFADYAAKTGDNGGTLVGVDAISSFIMRETTPPPDYVPPPAAVRVEDAPAAEKPSAATIREKAARGKRNGHQPARPVEAAKGGAA